MEFPYPRKLLPCDFRFLAASIEHLVRHPSYHVIKSLNSFQISVDTIVGIVSQKGS